MAQVVIFGVGQIAEIAYFYLTHDSEHDVVAFTVDSDYRIGNIFHNLPVVAYKKLITEYPPEYNKLFMPISYKNTNKIRAKKYYDAKNKGYSFISYISTKTIYYGTPIGENCFIFEGNVIQPYSEIGDNCILWSGNHVGHHSKIANHCFLASHVVVSGKVTVGENSFLGVNCTIADNVKIGRYNVIGANALILKDTLDESVYPSKETERSKVPSNRLRWSS
jgi:sugar O-acyltransferase (sialic acid O-acetyltransferase NeuD family)